MKTFKQYINEHFSWRTEGSTLYVTRSDEYDKMINEIGKYLKSNSLTFDKEEYNRDFDTREYSTKFAFYSKYNKPKDECDEEIENITQNIVKILNKHATLVEKNNPSREKSKMDSTFYTYENKKNGWYILFWETKTLDSDNIKRCDWNFIIKEEPELSAGEKYYRKNSYNKGYN